MATKNVIHLLITIEHSDSGGWVSPAEAADTIRENIDEYVAEELTCLEIPYELVQVQEVERVAPLQAFAEGERNLHLFKVVK